MATYHRKVLVFQVDRDATESWESLTDVTTDDPDAVSGLLGQYRTVCFDATREMPSVIPEIWDHLCRVSMDQGSTLVVCDELSQVQSLHRIGEFHLMAIRGRGAKRGCTLIQACQRVQKVNDNVWDMASHKFLFHLDEADEDYLASFIPGAETIKSLKPYTCYYVSRGLGGVTQRVVLPPVPPRLGRKL